MQEFVPKSGNNYVVMRHGESESNVAGVISANIENKDVVTEAGVQQVLAATDELKGHNIDLIIVSPFMRTQQTAELVREQLGLPVEAVIVDDSIREFDLADEFEGSVGIMIMQLTLQLGRNDLPRSFLVQKTVVM